MVNVKGYEKRTNAEGQDFYVLVLSGGIEMVKSNTTGRFYATQKETTVSCTMTKEECEVFIGQELPGSIRRVECDPYEITDEKTGEVISKSHRWDYVPEADSLEETILEEEVIGVHKHPLQEKFVM